MRIVVVDGGSTDGSQYIVKGFNVKNLEQYVIQGISEAAGQIFGAGVSESGIIMFTNSDIYVPPSWISEHVKWHEKGYDLVGGSTFWGGDKFALTWNMPRPVEARSAQSPGLGLGFSNCSVGREFFSRVGGLTNMQSQQDTEFTFRAVKAGGRMVLDPRITVYHDHPFQSFGKSFRRAFVYARNHVVVMNASYGRLVVGSGGPALVSISSLAKELLGLNAIEVFKDTRNEATANDIRPSLIWFVSVRLLSTKLGHLFGTLFGAIQPKKQSPVSDSHLEAVAGVR